jgi:hypothetical protein
MVAKPWDSKDNWVMAQLGDKKKCFFEVAVDLE